MRMPSKYDETENNYPIETMNSADGNLATIPPRQSNVSGNYSNDFDEMSYDQKIPTLRNSQASKKKSLLDSARKRKMLNKTPFTTNHSFSGSLKSIDL